jgi:hypothetical protein
VEVVLLFETRVAAHLRDACAEPVDPFLRDGLGNDDPPRSTAAKAVLNACVFVVEGVRGGNTERARDERELVRGVRQRERESPGLREAPERAEAPCQRARLARDTGAAVCRADDLVGNLVERQQLRGLRVLARRHLDVVATLAEKRDQRAEERHLRGVRDVDPDAHVVTLASQG